MNWLKKVFGGKPSREEFAKIAIQTLKESLGANINLDYKASEFCIRAQNSSGGESFTYYLENAFVEYCSCSGIARNGVLQTFFAPRQEIPDDFDTAVAHLLPRLQARSYYESLRYLPSEDYSPPSIPYSTFAEYFGISIVFDGPKTVHYLGTKSYERWKKQPAELTSTAIKNLERITDRPFNKLADGVYMPQHQDCHDASRLLLRSHIAQCRVKGRVIAMPITRDVLVITGEDDQQGHQIMLKTAEASTQDNRRFPFIPLVYSEGQWQEWELPATHPEFARFRYLKITSIAELYATQKNHLEKRFQTEGTDIFLASFMAYKDGKTGAINSQGAWTAGVHTLLPKVDYISFCRVSENDGNVECVVPWSSAQSIVGEMMVAKGMYPELYEVKEYPNPAQLSELKKNSGSMP